MRHVLTAAVLAILPLPAPAGESWDAIVAQLWDGREMQPAGDVIALDVPYRTGDDARTHLDAFVDAPEGLGLMQVSVILDENPMPVSAVFDLHRPQARFYLDVALRVNGPTPVHVVAETSDGQLFVQEAFIKTSGTGACAAPPGTDVDEAALTLGDMTLDLGTLPAGGARARLAGDQTLDVGISHPSLSGMQKDQISLLFIPMRYVETLDIDLNGAPYARMTGSISLSENPEVSLSVPGTTRSAEVTMTDTDGTVSTAQRRFPGF